MRDLQELGFASGRDIGQQVAAAFHASTGCALPDSYLQFLGHHPPRIIQFIFPFVSADGESWEACVTEFDNLDNEVNDLLKLGEQIIRPEHHGGRVFLRIGGDAGGNWLCLEFGAGEPTVVDLDYSTGIITTVSKDFAGFISLLQNAEDAY